MPEAAESEKAEERKAPSSHVVHEAVLSEGKEELARPSAALAWSGLAAGMSMGFSLVAEALLHSYLPAEPWRPLVAKLGYSVGFVLVILGRQQLFTENTLTPILPLFAHRDKRTLVNVLRLWAVVLVSNLFGGALFAVALAKTSVFDLSVQQTIYSISRDAMEPSFPQLLWRGVFAGWIIALTIWLMPFAESARLWVIILLTYLIGLGHLSHVIAGSIEAFTLAFAGQISWATALGHYTVPSLIGNTLGGIALVAFINHAQVVAGDSDD